VSRILSRLIDAVFEFLSSLKLAVIVVLGLAAAMTVATFIESLYDIPTGRYWVYETLWFYGLLALLGVNIFCVAMSRYPWKAKHGPFLMAHVGILLLLGGSWVTYQFGLDGNLRIPEGTTQSQVELNRPHLILSDGTEAFAVPVPWQPPSVPFKEINTGHHGLRITRYITFADNDVSFVPTELRTPQVRPAIKIRIEGGPMRIKQEYWLWGGSPEWRKVQAGPALLELDPVEGIGSEPKAEGAVPGGPRLVVRTLPDGVSLQSETTDAATGKPISRKISLKDSDASEKVLDLGWKAGVKITLVSWIRHAQTQVSYVPSKIQYGTRAPTSAIYLVAGPGGPGAEMWLGLGDRALLSVDSKDITVSYQNQRVPLPFGVELKEFKMTYYEGTRDPASYASQVSVIDGPTPGELSWISMNEPLQYAGITFYQASYEPAEPRPTVTVLSVNRDPGRELKYIGSLLIVLGSIWLFAVKYYRKAK
jgi:hypothetical protein